MFKIKSPTELQFMSLNLDDTVTNVKFVLNNLFHI